jgi:iron complex outermembrane receptor protein
MTGVLSKGARGALLTASTVLSPWVVQAQEATSTLPSVLVEGEAARSSTADVYFEPNAVTATKTDTPVLETPQSITTITREQLDDQNPQSVKDALNYTAGVLSSPDTNSRYDSIFLRGFGGFGTSTRVVDFLDGLKMPRGQGFGLPSIDPFLLDRIDVLKGPSAVLYGQTSPGGLVNQVSRAPSATGHNEIRVEGGSHIRLQGGLASEGAFDADGQWQYGIATIGRRSGTRQDDVSEERVAIAPSLAWQPTDDTRLTLRGFYQYDPEGGYFNSIYPKFMAPKAYKSALDSDLNVGDPDFESYNREQYAFGYEFEHRFNDTVAIESKARYSAMDFDFRGLQMAGELTSGGLLPRQAARSIEVVGGVSTDNHARFDFDTGPVTHTVLAGVDVQRFTSDWEYRFGMAPALDVTDPQYGVAIGPLTTILDSRQRLWQTGAYVQEQLGIAGFRAVLGFRHDWIDQQSENRLAGTTTNQSSSSPSYRAGILYKFDTGIAPFASYSTSFEATEGVDIGGSPFDPTKAEQWEVGIKYEPTFLDALFTVTAFHIRQENVLTPDATTGFNVQQGEVVSRGLEFEARGNATKNLELIGALTLLDTEVTESSVATNIGKRPQAVPTIHGSAWANYGFDREVLGGVLDGLTLGGGIRFTGPSYADDANTVKTDGYALLDAAVGYDLGTISPTLKGATATLNATNILNTEYYSSCTSRFYCQYGTGAQVLAGLRYSW